MTESKPVVRVGKIQQRILLIRGEKVIVDADLAEAIINLIDAGAKSGIYKEEFGNFGI